MGRSNKCGGKVRAKKSNKCGGKVRAKKSKKCGGKSGKGGDIVFASSMKAQRFIDSKLEGQTIESVGGINGVLGPRLQQSGVCNAKDLSCKLRGYTKRNYLRFIMKVSPLVTILIYH